MVREYIVEVNLDIIFIMIHIYLMQGWTGL